MMNIKSKQKKLVSGDKVIATDMFDFMTTPDHPFYVKEQGFKNAGDLKAGDIIVNAAGDSCIVEMARQEVVEKPETVYNFQVEDYHTYYVGDSCVLVHNNGGCPDPNKKVKSPYSNLKDSKYAGEGKKFRSSQKKNIIKQNMERNGGVIKSDLSGETLVPATKSKKGVTPNTLEAQIDHIFPRSKGGSNSYSNAQVLSRKENIIKSDK